MANDDTLNSPAPPVPYHQSFEYGAQEAARIQRQIREGIEHNRPENPIPRRYGPDSLGKDGQ